MNIEIRKAVESDAANLQKYISKPFSENLSRIYKKDQIPSIEHQEQFIRTILSAPNSTLLLAVKSGTIVGMLDAHGSSHAQKSHCMSFGMSVSRDSRRKGIGEQLLCSLKNGLIKITSSELSLKFFLKILMQYHSTISPVLL